MKPYKTTTFGELYLGDCLEVLPHIKDKSVDLCLTSPPYFQQRKYSDNEKEIGWEESDTEYTIQLTYLFSQVNRILKDTGSLYVNIGDKYDDKKSMRLIPERFASLMKSNGWILRNVLLWDKTAFQPTSAEDRFIYTHEHIFFFTKKKAGYYFLKPTKTMRSYQYRNSVWRLPINTANDIESHFAPYPVELVKTVLDFSCPKKVCEDCGAPYMPVFRIDRQKLDVKKHSKMEDAVTVELGKTSVFRGNTATERYFLGYRKNCSCSTDVTVEPVVLDPFMGAGTTAVVCEDEGVRWIGCELVQKNCDLIYERVVNRSSGLKVPKKIDGTNNLGLIPWQKLQLSKKPSSKKSQ